MSNLIKISGSLGEKNFSKLRKFKKIEHLEISLANLEDEWVLIQDLNNLKTISIKDSYIDFQSFYNSLAKLKKLEKITYNYYCYFNKKPKEKLRNISIPIKSFQIDFPNKNLPNFDFNNYLKETYKNKFHSICELENGSNIFKDLEEISFINFDVFQNFIIYFDDIDKNYLKKNIFWGFEKSKLSKFKKLKNIKINNGNYTDILDLNLEKQIINLSKNNISINGYSKILHDYPAEIKLLNIFFSNKNISGNFDYEQKPQLKKIMEEMNINKYSLTLNEKDIFKDSTYAKPFKLSNKKEVKRILDHDYENIIFSNCYRFLDNKSSGRNSLKKTEIYLEILKFTKIKNVFFDLSKFEFEADYEWTHDQFNFLMKFIYELLKKHPKIKIFLFHKEIDKLLSGQDSTDKFKKHFIYITDTLETNDHFNNVEFIGANKTNLKKSLNSYIREGVDQIVVVDDIIYNASNIFPNHALIYGEDLDELKLKFPKFNEDVYYEKRWKKINYPLKDIFHEILRICSFGNENFESDNSKLTAVIKKEYFKNLDNLKYKKVYYYLGSPLHLITHNVDVNDKNWHISKSLKSINQFDNKKDLDDKILNFYKKSLNQICNSADIDKKKLEFDDSIFDANNFQILDDIGLNKNKNSNLTHLWIEGVVPWRQKYIKLSNLDKLIPTKNLENLRLSDCIYFDDYEIPKLEKLKVLELHFNHNHHQEKKYREIYNFENCPNLEKLVISNLNGFYNKNYYPLTRGSSLVDWDVKKNDTFSIINLNLKKLHELNKLEYLKINEIQASDVKNIKCLPSVKEVKLMIYHNSLDDYLSDYEVQSEVKDKDLLFFKESKKIQDLDLSIGQINDIDEPGYGQCYSSYDGNGDFIDYINYKIENLKLSINLNLNNQTRIQDIINKITNRMLNLKKLVLDFGIASTTNNFDYEQNKYVKPLEVQTIDFSKFAKLKKLTDLSFQSQDEYGFLKFKTINFASIVNLKKIKNIDYCWSSISLNEFRKARIALKEEKYEDPVYYDPDYEYYAEEDENYRKNWSRMTEINTDSWDWYSLEQRFLNLEKEENKKKFEKKTIIKTKTN